MKKVVGIIVAVLLVVLDQATKYWAIAKLMNKPDFVVIKNVLCFHYLENTGIVWGMFSDSTAFFAVTTTIMTIAILYIYMRTPMTKRMMPLNILELLIIAGAIGNLIDRVFRKFVVDFIYVEALNFPVFNVADCYVTVSAILLAILVLFYYKEEDFKFLKRDKKSK